MSNFVIFRPVLSANVPPSKWGVRHLGVGVVHNPNYTEFEAHWLANFHHYNREATAQTALNELELYMARLTEPPARMVPASQDDLALAVRRMFTKVGKVDEAALLRFIIKVLGEQVPEQSPDPEPLLVALETIASGFPTNEQPYIIARTALETYNGIKEA